MESRLSPQTAAAVDAILAAEQGQLYQIELVLFTANDAAWRYSPPIIDSLLISQRFEQQVFDAAEVVMQTTTADYVAICDHHRDLMAAVKLHRVDTDTGAYLDLVREYAWRVLIASEVNPALTTAEHTRVKTETDAVDTVGINMTTVPMKLQLYEPAAMQLRKHQTNFILRNATVGDAIKLLCNAHGIATLELAPPDNTKVYPLLALPTLDFRQSLAYLQQSPGLGVFRHGLSIYSTDAVSYIYSAHATETPWINPTTTVVVVPEDNLAGGKSYHLLADNGDLSIISSGRISQVEYAHTALENRGTSIWALDDVATLAPSALAATSTGVRIGELLTIRQLADTDGWTTQVHTPQYTKDHGNWYTLEDELTRNRNVLVTVQWSHAVPGLIKPGHRIRCIYTKTEQTDNGEVRRMITGSYEGVCISANYVMGRVTHSAGIFHACSCGLKFRMHPVD